MKYFIASDIHGSSYWCRKMLDAFENSKAERMILLGDILYHGPRNDLPKDYDTKAVTAMLNEYKDRITCVQGNCDAEVDQMVLEFQIHPGYLREDLSCRSIYLTHGHTFHAEDEGTSLPENMQTGDILIHGHTHLPVAEIRKCGEKKIYVLNPGSVSIPKGGFENSYALLTEESFTIYDYAGNVIKAVGI